MLRREAAVPVLFPATALAVVAVVVALAGALLTPTVARVPAAPPGAAAEVDAPVPVLHWQPCDGELGVGVECATATVPLDYDDPDGATVDLDLARVPAAEPAQRIGSLFVNPGGPGGSSRGFAPFFGRLVPREVSARFDIVGIDPRGVGPSARMRCATDAERPRFPRAFFPTTRKQVRQQIRFDRWVRLACSDRPSRIVGQMTTADTA